MEMIPSFDFTLDGEKLHAYQKGTYADGTPAVQVTNADGEPWCILTVSVPKVRLSPGEILVKGWSENERTFQRLVELGVLQPTGRVYPTGFVQAQVCTVHPPH